MNGLFITGTDTDVGKTWVTGRLCRGLRDRGLDVGVWKPVQSGFPPGDPQSDSNRLRLLSGVSDSDAMIGPVSFRAPLAPMLAAHLEGKTLSCSSLIAAGELLFEKHELSEFIQFAEKKINKRYILFDTYGLAEGEYDNKWRIRMNVSKEDIKTIAQSIY